VVAVTGLLRNPPIGIKTPRETPNNGFSGLVPVSLTIVAIFNLPFGYFFSFFGDFRLKALVAPPPPCEG
jgi:hypothetical protein